MYGGKNLMRQRRAVRLCTTVALAAMVWGSALSQVPATAPAAAPGPTGPAAEVQRSYAGLKANILKAANGMPADSFTWKPTADVRTFARVVNHVSEAQLRSCATVNRTAQSAVPPVPSETADKAAIIQALQASFAECDRAFASLTDANLSDMFALGPTHRSRIGLLWGTVSHDNEQYATLALYMRLKGLVPPSAEK